MGIKEMFNNIGRFVKEKNKPIERLPDDVTNDKYLKSLRRQRRLQLEEQEKKLLQSQIRLYEQNRTREHLYGFKSQPMRDKMMVPKNKFRKREKKQGKYDMGDCGFL